VGNLFLHTSNPRGATGDGIAMAYRIGAEILHAEYIQFHPTVLFHRDVNRFLITESLRGEGARLINRRSEFFMDKYELGDLAPRDEVSRAIFKEMEAEGSQYVRLDASRIKNIDLKERFPGVYETCMMVGLAIDREPIPVVPAAHYSCGGVKTDLWGRTSVRSLYAVGEAACTGVHGANRLASVSLVEGLLFGIRSALHIHERRSKLPQKLVQSIPDWIYPAEQESFEPVLIHNDMRHIRSLMWNYVGIIRTQKRLVRALSDLDYLSHRIDGFYKQARLTKDIIELRSAVLTAIVIVRAALSNKAARGAHYLE
jgi:L-aspartate oxidase